MPPSRTPITGALALSILVTVSASADPAPLTSILEGVAARYESLESYDVRGSFDARFESGGRSQTLTSEMHLAGRPPELIREELVGARGHLMVQNAETRWIFLPSANKYEKQDIKAGDAPATTVNLTKFAELDTFADRATDLGEEPLTLDPDGEAIDVVARKIALPAEASGQVRPGASVDSYTVWVAPDSHTIVREEFVISRTQPAPTTIHVTVSYDDVNVDTPVDDALFAFEPPAGATPLQAGPAPGPMEGKAAPDLTLTTLTGETITMSELRGKVVLVDFWATWCGPCKREMPHIQKLFEDLSDDGLVVLAISNEKEATIRRYIDSKNYTFPTLVDEGAEVTRRYGVTAYPTLFVVDREGTISSHLVGLRPESALREALRKAGLDG